MVLPSGLLSDEAMMQAFGPSALFYPAPSPTQSETGIKEEELDRLKNLNVNDILRHFRGDDDPHSPPLAHDTINTPSRTAAADLAGSQHWPSL